MKFLILILSMICSIQVTNSTPTLNYAVKDNVELTKENVWKFINTLPIQHPSIVYKKIMLETAHLKSKIAINNNNLCGMKRSKVRPNIQLGERYGHAVYDDWRDSIVDYLLWQQYCIKRKLSEEEFYAYISRTYSTNKQYVNTLKRMKPYA